MDLADCDCNEAKDLNNRDVAGLLDLSVGWVRGSITCLVLMTMDVQLRELPIWKLIFEECRIGEKQELGKAGNG